MFKLARWQENIAVLETVLASKTIAGELVAQFSFEKPFTENDFVNLLYYFGNLTIETRNQAGEIVFRILNRIIEELYWITRIFYKPTAICPKRRIRFGKQLRS
jgi:hypothetical protein